MEQFILLSRRPDRFANRSRPKSNFITDSLHNVDNEACTNDEYKTNEEDRRNEVDRTPTTNLRRTTKFGEIRDQQRRQAQGTSSTNLTYFQRTTTVLHPLRSPIPTEASPPRVFSHTLAEAPRAGPSCHRLIDGILLSMYLHFLF